MNVLSLFDGISCGQVALNRAGIEYENYFASEIDKNAILITQKNFPGTIQLGDVENWKSWDLPRIDLLIGGSPCQGFSKSGKGLNFEDPRSKLFFEYVAILKAVKPKYFLLENVQMKKEWRDVISEYLEVEPILINSELVSAGKRPRTYWTNIPGIKQPKDKGILLESILENGEVDKDKAYCLDANYFKGTNVKQYLSKSRRQIVWQIPEATKKGYVEVSEGQCIDLTFIKSTTRRGRLMLEKSNCLTASSQKMCKVTKDWFRLLTPVECERIQTLPDNYTHGISNSARYKALGNGWTVDVVVHIFQNLVGNPTK
jgi:site-specific DNA-cytosine methylase